MGKRNRNNQFWIDQQSVHYLGNAVKMWNPVEYFSLAPSLDSVGNNHNTQRHRAPSNILILLELVGMEIIGKGCFLIGSSLKPCNPNYSDVCTSKIMKTLCDTILFSWIDDENSSIILNFLLIIFCFWSPIQKYNNAGWIALQTSLYITFPKSVVIDSRM